MAVIHSRRFHDHRQVPPGGDGYGDHRHLNIQNTGVLIIQSQPVIRLGGVPSLQLNDHINFLRILNGTHTKDPARINNANAPQLHKVANVAGRRTHQCFVADLANFHRIIGDQSVSALDQLYGRLTFTRAALTGNEYTFAVHLHQHTVACDPGGQFCIQISD